MRSAVWGFVVSCLYVFVLIASWVSWYYAGKQQADVYYANHPVEITYHQQQIIIQQGDAICPLGDACQWRAWDITTNSEVPLGYKP